MENPTRNARARAMWFLRGAASAASFSGVPPRIMKTSAAARLPMMATKAPMTRNFINRIIRPCLHLGVRPGHVGACA